MVTVPEAFNHLTIAFNHQNRKSHCQPSNVSVFSKVLLTHFSVNELQRISKLKDLNSYLALKAAITSRRDINNFHSEYRIKSGHSRTPSFIEAKLG